MTYAGGRTVSVMEPGRRRRPGRFSEGPWSIESASGGTRPYAKHARSLSARNLRQRVIALTLGGAVVVAITIVAAPKAVNYFRAKPSVPLQNAVAVRNEAAAWIARWVSSSAVVACDRLMCSTLLAHQVRAEQFMPINPSSIDPVGSDVVVETAVVRSLFRGRLGAVYAPAILAKFGSGDARIEIRVTSRYGSVRRFERKLQASVSARRLGGQALLSNKRIAESALAARQLRAGMVDSRILATIAPLAAMCRLTILGFAGAAPGASKGMPLLSVDITEGDSADGGPAVSAGYERVEMPASLARILAFLRAQRQPLHPASVREITTPGGLTFIRVDYAAPTPLSFPDSTA